MFRKALILACLAVGILAEYEVSEEKKEFLKGVLLQQCTKNGAADKADEVENAGKAFAECAKGLFDVETVKKEIEEAKPKGDLDEVFGKYCAKSPQLKTCISTLIDSVAPCLDPELRKYVDDGKKGADQLIDFVCYKDGDRIAMFIAENGPECFKDKADGIRACAEKLTDTVSTVEEARNLPIAKQCEKYDDLTKCIVKSLEECSNPTPGNMAESLFRYVRKSSPCDKALPKAQN